jgi:4-oxalocrotonate tautomerase
MPLIQVSLIEGRAPQVKRALVAEVTDAVVRTLEAPRETVRVILNEVPPEHWAVGGVPRSASAQPTTLTDRSTR